MRVLLAVFLLVACAVSSPMAAGSVGEDTEKPEATAQLRVAFTIRLPEDPDAFPETAILLVDGLTGIRNLEEFNLIAREAGGSLRVGFEFGGMSEFIEWYESRAVQILVILLDEASAEPLRVEMRGFLAHE